MYDVLIIGAGITGTLIARELSRYQIKVLVLEKDNDVGNRTTNANSAIIHSGYDPLPGTLKAKFNVLANPMFDQLTEELDVPFMRIGSLTVATYDEQLPILKQLEERSKINGVEVKLLSASEVKAMEPNISPDVKG
ncbi:MAG: FAD-dependent oxidoreductase, partial [Bacilli bacterium]|nr:FAD-dependent oxidoreductase [Bacilli bacterium]